MQRDIVLKKFNFDLLTPRVSGGGGLWAIQLLPYCYICQNLSICSQDIEQKQFVSVNQGL